LLDAGDYLYPMALGDYYYQRNQKRDAIYYYKKALMNHANIYNIHTIKAFRWHGYKTISNDILPENRLDYPKPYLDEKCLIDKLSGMYNGFGQIEEVRLFKKYKDGDISINRLLNKLNEPIAQ
jgi:hypothetical protein